MKIQSVAAGAMLAMAATAHAQKVEVQFDPIEGPPCVARSLDRSNAYQAPVQRAVYSSRVTEMKAVIVAGSGRPVENAVIAQCGELAKRDLGSSRSATNVGLFAGLFRDQVQECIQRRDPRMPIYDIHFVRADRCVTAPPGR